MNTESLEKRLGKRLATRRKNLGWTQEFLAHSLSVETETISRIERGVTIPSLKTLEKLAELLSVSLEDLVATKYESKPLNEFDGLILMLKQLHPKDQDHVVESMRTMIIYLAKIRHSNSN